jgi:hypothetical protein
VSGDPDAVVAFYAFSHNLTVENDEASQSFRRSLPHRRLLQHLDRWTLWRTHILEVIFMFAASIIRALLMGVASTSETSVHIYQTTQHNNPEDSHLHTRRRDNLKSHLLLNISAR